jgi:hypothetical protein
LVRGFREFRDEGSRGLQNKLLLVPGLAGNLRRREWSSLHDVQKCKLWNAYTFNLIHNKVAIQIKEYYISIINLTTLHWAVIYWVLLVLFTLIKQQG